MILLKQSTAATLRVGPFMDITDAVTPETGVDLSTVDQAELLKASGATVDISGATWAAITGADGWYDLSLTTSLTDTVGMLTVVVQDASLCLPVFVRAMVVPANVWASLVGGTEFLDTSGTVRRNTATGGGAGTITLDAGASATDDFYNRLLLFAESGPGALQPMSEITDYVGSTKVASLSPAPGTDYASGTVFVIVNAPDAVSATEVADEVQTSAAANPLPANLKEINDVALTGDGSATPWGPA